MPKTLTLEDFKLTEREMRILVAGAQRFLAPEPVDDEVDAEELAVKSLDLVEKRELKD